MSGRLATTRSSLSTPRASWATTRTASSSTRYCRSRTTASGPPCGRPPARRPSRRRSPSWLASKLEGQSCWAGLDLSAKTDLTAWCLLFQDGWCWWRLWCPEAVARLLSTHTAGRFDLWVKDGWVTLTDGDTIDYERVYDDIEADWNRFNILGGAYDRWSTEPVRQEILRRTGLELLESQTTYERMTAPMQEFMRLLKEAELQHGGHPVLRWMADNLEARSPVGDPDRVRPVKPDRARVGKRIDGMVTLFLA